MRCSGRTPLAPHILRMLQDTEADGLTRSSHRTHGWAPIQHNARRANHARRGLLWWYTLRTLTWLRACWLRPRADQPPGKERRHERHSNLGVAAGCNLPHASSLYIPPDAGG